jgi:hypothetical protein
LAINVGCVAAETDGTSAARNRKSESVDRRVIGGEFIRLGRSRATLPAPLKLASRRPELGKGFRI